MKKVFILVVAFIFCGSVLILIKVKNRKTLIVIGNWKGDSIEIGRMKTIKYNQSDSGFHIEPKNQDEFFSIIDSYFGEPIEKNYPIYYETIGELHSYGGNLYFKDDNYYYLYGSDNCYRLKGLYGIYNFEDKVYNIVLPDMEFGFQASDLSISKEIVFNYSFEDASSFYSKFNEYVYIDYDLQIIRIKGYERYSKKQMSDDYLLSFDFMNQIVQIAYEN